MSDKCKQDELNRLLFVKDRDGYMASVEFARIGLITYRKHLFTKAGKAYRVPLICSCIVYRAYIKEYVTNKIKEFEKIKFNLRYGIRTRNIKQPTDKCAYSANLDTNSICYYKYARLKFPSCPFNNQCNCSNYISIRCMNWQLEFNKRFNK